MPVMSGNVVYDKLEIKPPVTLRMQLLKSTLSGCQGLCRYNKGYKNN